MESFITETRTYVGQPGTIAFDGFSGFVIGQAYQLRFERQFDGMVVVYLDHLQCGPLIGPLLVKHLEFEKWWVRLAADGERGGV